MDLPRAELTLGLLGLGPWGAVLLHHLVHALRHCDRIVAYDPSEERRAKVMARFPAVRVVETEAELFEAPGLSAVAIAAPSAMHAELAEKALRQNLDVYLETPIALDAEAAKGLAEEAKRRERVLMSGHLLLYSPSVEHIRSRLAQEQLGPLLRISAQRLGGRRQKHVGVLWDLASHEVALFNHWLCELPKTVYAIQDDGPITPDSAFLSLRYKSGLIAQIEVAWTSPIRERRMTFTGAYSTLIFDDTKAFQPLRNLLHDNLNPQIRPVSQIGEVLVPGIRRPDPLRLAVTEFIESLQSRKCPRASAEAAVDVVRVLDAAERSLQTGHAVDLLTD